MKRILLCALASCFIIGCATANWPKGLCEVNADQEPKWKCKCTELVFEITRKPGRTDILTRCDGTKLPFSVSTGKVEIED